MGLWTWFKNSQRTAAARERQRTNRAAKLREDEELRAPHYYAFYYPEGREPGSGWKHPKMYVGPCETKECIEDEIAQSWPSRADEPRSRFKVRRLTADQFTEIWGDPPGSAATRR
jgi:hypothetical protein